MVGKLTVVVGEAEFPARFRLVLSGAGEDPIVTKSDV